MCKQYVEEGLQSQATQHELRLDSTPEEILKQYTQRDSFFTTFPLIAAFVLHQAQNPQKANECALGLQAYNQGGQIGNDLNDLTPKANGRYRFSDIKNGQVTLPISLLYTRLDETQREYFLSRFGNRDLTKDEAAQIRGFIEGQGIIDLGLEVIRQRYETARTLLKGNLSEEWQTCFDSLCTLQMQKFSKYKLEY
jgi:geranylgeranyl pyrophosphate synthase